MGMRINTNIISIRAQRQLSKSKGSLEQALQRLSSGTRINSARDDAAGLAISEGLRATVRGLRQAIRNSNDGIGFLQVAEGALSESSNIVQRIRELAIQSANGAIADKDRANLNQEVQALIAEFNRIATDTDFNGVKLLNGTFQTTDLQVGTQKGQSISFSIGDARASQMGKLAVASSSTATATYFAAAHDSQYINQAIGSGQLRINNTLIEASEDDGVSTSDETFSALAIANAINEKSGATNVTAEANATTVTFSSLGFSRSDFSGSFTGNQFLINNVAITGNAGSAQSLATIINDKSNATGVTCEVVSSTSVKLLAKDGRNIQLELRNASNAGTLFAGTVANSAGSGNLSVYFDMTNITSDTAFAALAGTENIGVRTGRVTLYSSSEIVVSQDSGTNSAALGFAMGTYGKVDGTELASVTIATQDGAQDSLRTLDAVIQQIVEIRARLGAVQNRLEATISNLGAVTENLQAAESQIRDTDIAAETAELTRAQILQQAGVAVLGQANVSSQVALNLLQF